MKFTKRHLVVLGIAVLFILFGLVQGVTGLEINKKIIDQVSFVLLIAAAFILFSGRKKKADESSDVNKEDEVKQLDETEAKDNGENNTRN